ncbi:DUF3553 domain-containing protein [Aestuariispira insulae]|uniref:Uncharacterized protein DUF3553 n=1 Tax=Aestuariispira insulae TaxID=1461337 RepID=A0A3D9HVQ5_9PROT|nr:DUF3553 domain-containing protein [Aestuariispira insulae]RED53593.1 uncharacterized protein DUF3553 [Aestuariispira insulae]
MTDNIFTPGQFVVLQNRPHWGTGQVQSMIDGRITVNFEHAGKQVIMAGQTMLVAVSAEDGVETAEILAPDR